MNAILNVVAPATKLVRITLAALTRVEYNEVVEVPTDITDEELNRLVDQRYDQVDGGLYQSDPEYWVRGRSCGYEAVQARDIGGLPERRVTRDESGDLSLGENTYVELRLALEKVGYCFTQDADEDGMWIWSSPDTQCDSSFHSDKEAVDVAWLDAVKQTKAIRELSDAQWDALSLDQMMETVVIALTDDLGI